MLFPELLLLKKMCTALFQGAFVFRHNCLGNSSCNSSFPEEQYCHLSFQEPLHPCILSPRGPFVLPLVNLSARNENLDPLYTGIYAS